MVPYSNEQVLVQSVHQFHSAQALQGVASLHLHCESAPTYISTNKEMLLLRAEAVHQRRSDLAVATHL